MLDCLEDLSRSIFGSWPNMTQGFLGSAVGSGLGVYGAYLVASHQMRHDRESRRMSAGGQAAATILEALLPLAEELHALRTLDPAWDYDQDGLSSWHLTRWRECRSAFEVSLVLRGHLLPSNVADDLEGLARRLEDVIELDVDEDNHVLIYADTASTEILEAVSDLTATARESLTAYARSVLGDHR